MISKPRNPGSDGVPMYDDMTHLQMIIVAFPVLEVFWFHLGGRGGDDNVEGWIADLVVDDEDGMSHLIRHR